MTMMKIENMSQLRKEKRKLRRECKEHEQHIAVQFDSLRENAGTIVVDSLIRAIPKINIINIFSSIFRQYVGKHTANKEENGSAKGFGSGLISALIPLGITLGMKFFRRASKK